MLKGGGKIQTPHISWRNYKEFSVLENSLVGPQKVKQQQGAGMRTDKWTDGREEPGTEFTLYDGFLALVDIKNTRGERTGSPKSSAGNPESKASHGV